jgi:hypothetical protein
LDIDHRGQRNAVDVHGRKYLKSEFDV